MHYVLVVSDDEENNAFLKHAFHGQPGNIPVTFMKGLPLLNFIQTCSPVDLPFLIVIDLHLVDIDSLELLIKVKAALPSKLIPVAIMSGFASGELISNYYGAGANCFYKKPLDLSDWNHMADCLVTLFYNTAKR